MGRHGSITSKIFIFAVIAVAVIAVFVVVRRDSDSGDTESRFNLKKNLTVDLGQNTSAPAEPNVSLKLINDSGMEDVFFEPFVNKTTRQYNESRVTLKPVNASKKLRSTNFSNSTDCQRNFLVEAQDQNVRIHINGDSGKIDVLYEPKPDGTVVCQNGTAADTRGECIPQGLLSFLNKQVVTKDIVTFQCSSGLATDNPQDCLPVYSDSPPEEFVTIKCRHSNYTIPSLDCKDICYASMVRWYLNELGKKGYQ